MKDRDPDTPGMPRTRRGGRLALLSFALAILAVFYLVTSFSATPPTPPPAEKEPPWLTKERFLAYADGRPFQPPDSSEPIKFRKEQIESLVIDHEDGGFARVTFAIKTDTTRYDVTVIMTMHSSDGMRYPSHFKPWDVVKP